MPGARRKRINDGVADEGAGDPKTLVKLDRFVAERAPGWSELERLSAGARRKPERLGPDGVRSLGALYRGAAADLALARRKFPGDPVVARLEELVGRARHLVYDAKTRRSSALHFFSRRYWRLVASRPLPLLIAAALLIAPAALAGGWAASDPDKAVGLVPGEFRSVAEPREEGTDLGLSLEEQGTFATQILTNNIRVTFLAFAGGISAGLLTAALTLYNGVVLGAAAGLSVSGGNGTTFYELVAAHGVLELSCIVVAAAAGLRMGWALVEPGRGTRLSAVMAEARNAVEIVLGTAPWLVVAGLVEGFITPRGLGFVTVTVVGFGLASVYWGLVVWRGREPQQVRAA
nr:stage II sporulation protein M [Actinomycetota bacterium]